MCKTNFLKKHLFFHPPINKNYILNIEKIIMSIDKNPKKYYNKNIKEKEH